MKARARSLVPGLVVAAALLAASAAVAEEEPAWPAGSEKAVEGFHRAFPDGVLDQVARPTGFASGEEGGPPLYWECSYHEGDRKGTVPVTPEGAVVRRQDTVEVASLPEAVRQAVEKEGKPDSVACERTAASIRFVARKAPIVAYRILADQGEMRCALRLAGDGALLGKKEAGMAADPVASPPGPPDGLKEGTIPEGAEKAVAAVKVVYPAAVVQMVELVPVDDGTGEIEMLYYEVEFPDEGKDKEIRATPDGIVLDVDVPVAAADLPPTIAAAIERELPGATVRSARRTEDRASLRFAALSAPRVVYVASYTRGGKAVAVHFSAAGAVIEPLNPWKKR